MTRLLIACAFSVLFSPPTPVGAARHDAAYRFQSASVRAGSEFEIEAHMVVELAMLLEADDQTLPGMDLTSENRQEKRVHVLSVGEGGPDRIEVFYGELEEVEIAGEEETRTVSPYQGRGFRIDLEDGDYSVLEEGEAVSQETTEWVLGAETCEDGFLPALSSLTWELADEQLDVGDELELDDDLTRLLLGDGRDELEEASMKLVLEGDDLIDGRPCARFSVTSHSVGELEGDLELSIQVEGELWVDLEHGLLRQMELSGPMTLAGDRSDSSVVKLSGEGTLTVEFHVSQRSVD